MIIDDLISENTVVTHVPGVFRRGELFFAANLDWLAGDMYESNMVVALPEARDQHRDLGRMCCHFDRGQPDRDTARKTARTAFIIFDTHVVQMLTQ